MRFFINLSEDLCPSNRRLRLILIKSSIKIRSFGVNEKRLKTISKTRDAESNQDFKQFLNRIIQKKSPGTETLKAWLREIIDEEF